MNREDAIRALTIKGRTRGQAEAFLDLLGSGLRRRGWAEGEPLADADVADRWDRLTAHLNDDEVKLCRSCERPFAPTHDASAPGATSRHPFVDRAMHEGGPATEHHVSIKVAKSPLWNARCICGWFRGQVTWRLMLRDAWEHLAKTISR